jgi:hypothetical protein
MSLIALCLNFAFGQVTNPFGAQAQPGNQAQPTNPFSPTDEPEFKKMREVDAEFDLAKIGAIGRPETNALSQKIWTQFRKTHDFDGHSVFTEAKQGACPDTPEARLAFAHYVKSQKPFIRFLDLQNCPKPGCVKGRIEYNNNGFVSTMACQTCEGTGRLGNVFNYTMLYTAELSPLPAPVRGARPEEAVAPTPLAAFCSSNYFMPTRLPEPEGSEVILGRVDLEYASSGVSLALKIIDTSKGHGGSAYFAVIRLIDSDMVTLAELTHVYLPVRGGVLSIPLAKFSPRRGQSVGASSHMQLSLLKNTYGIRLESERHNDGEGLISTSVSVLKPKAGK